MPRETRRDASKLETGSRRWHNTRKIAIGGARLDSRLSDFRSATKSAENRERALNRRLSVFVFCPPPPSPRTSPLSCKREDLSSLFSFHLSTAGERETRRTGLFKLSRLFFIHSIFLHALCLLYTLARATVFCVAQNQTMTAARCVSSLMFYPSILLHFLRKVFANSTQFHPFAYFLYLSPPHFRIFFLHRLTFNYTFDVTYILYIFLYVLFI